MIEILLKKICYVLSIIPKLEFEVKNQKIFYLDTITTIPHIKPRIKIDIEDITSDNVDQVGNFRDSIHIKNFKELLKEGQYGIFAKFNGKVVGHGWAAICRKDWCRINNYFDISKNEALIHYCNVDKYFRGNNIYPFMLAHLCNRLFCQEKIARIFIDTGIDNYASLKGISKVCFKPLCRGTYIQFRGRLIFKYFKPIDL